MSAPITSKSGPPGPAILPFKKKQERGGGVERGVESGPNWADRADQRIADRPYACTADDLYEWQERAAIMESDGGLERATAELEAQLALEARHR